MGGGFDFDREDIARFCLEDEIDFGLVFVRPVIRHEAVRDEGLHDVVFRQRTFECVEAVWRVEEKVRGDAVAGAEEAGVGKVDFEGIRLRESRERERAFGDAAADFDEAGGFEPGERGCVLVGARPGLHGLVLEFFVLFGKLRGEALPDGENARRLLRRGVFCHVCEIGVHEILLLALDEVEILRVAVGLGGLWQAADREIKMIEVERFLVDRTGRAIFK